MDVLLVLVALMAVLVVVAGMTAASGVRIIAQYEKGVVFRLGRVRAVRDPGCAC